MSESYKEWLEQAHVMKGGSQVDGLVYIQDRLK